MKIVFPILIGILFLFEKLNSQNGIAVELNMPKEMSIKQSADIILNLKKPAGMTSYATFKQVVPAGFSVNPKTLNGTDFKFENHELIITWLRLPPGENVRIVWEMSVNGAPPGNYELSGTFDYVIDNARGSIELAKYPIRVTENVTVSDSDISNDVNLAPKINRLRDDVSCVRSIKFDESKKYFIVEIKIKSQIGGQFSVVEKIPDGYAFKDFEHPNAILRPGTANPMFMMDHVLPNKEYILKYILIPFQDFLNKKPDVYGKLSFIYSGEIINVSIVDSE